MTFYRIASVDMAVDSSLEGLYGFVTFISEPVAEPLLTILQGQRLNNWMVAPLHSFDTEGYTCDFARRGDTVLFRMKGWEKGDVHLTEIHFDGASFKAFTSMDEGSPVMLRRFGMWIVYGVAAASQQTVSIHSSTILYKSKAVMFLGESGTGKSTQTRLWMENIPGAERLNDDSPMLRIDGGRVLACGSPWSGKTHCYKPMEVPLAAVVRLSQAPHNAIRRLSPIASFGALQPSCPPSFSYDEVLSGQVFDTLSAALRSVPAYGLECLPNADAARLVLETLEKDGRL